MGGNGGNGFLSAFDYVLSHAPSPEHILLLDDVLKMSKDLFKEFNPVLDYEQSYPYMFVVSHLADADGLGAIPPLKFGLPEIIDKVITGTNVSSERIMSYQSFGKDSLLGIIEGLEKDFNRSDRPLVLFSTDIGDFPYDDAQIALDESGFVQKIINLDHHQPIELPKDKRIVTINPCDYGLSGEKELSGSMLSTLSMLAMARQVKDEYEKEDYFKDERVRKEFSVLEEKLDYLTIVGLAGASADMQKQEGINGLIYDYLEEKGILSSVKSPFFGYRTKTISASIIESEIPINMKYNVPSKKQMRKIFLEEFGKNIEGLSDEKRDFVYDEAKFLFAVQGKGARVKYGVNEQYLDALSVSETMKLNEKLKGVLGYSPLKCSTSIIPDVLRPDESSIDALFDDYTDDLKEHDTRLTLGNALLGDFEITADTRLADLSQEDKDVLFAYCKDNVKAFADPKIRDEMLNKFDDDLYLVNASAFSSLETNVLSDLSVPEIGKMMTAVSKMGKGEVFYQAVKEDIATNEYDVSSSGLGGESSSDALKRVVLEYNRAIRLGANTVEEYVRDKNRLETLGDNVYFVSIDDLDLGEVHSPELVYKLTGVFGGLACNTRQLPGNYGVLATGFTFDETPGDELVKVSLRVNPIPGKEHIHFGQYLSGLVGDEIVINGGGHPSAASCRLKAENVPFFKELLKETKFFYDKGD